MLPKATMQAALSVKLDLKRTQQELVKISYNTVAGIPKIIDVLSVLQIIP